MRSLRYGLTFCGRQLGAIHEYIWWLWSYILWLWLKSRPQRILSSQYFGSVPLLSSVWLWNRFDILFPGYAPPALADQWSCGSWIHSPKGFKMLRRALRPSSRGILTLCCFRNSEASWSAFTFRAAAIESLDWPEVLSWCDFTHLIWTMQQKQVH